MAFLNKRPLVTLYKNGLIKLDIKLINTSSLKYADFAEVGHC